VKIIHTSDWHLGRHFGPVSLETDQQNFADWFVELVADQNADLVVIAGDLFDRAIAPISAIGLFNDTVGRLLGAGAVVAAISGNHDGANRVAPYDDLMDRSGFYLRGGYQGAGEVISHEFADGPLDLVLLPFLDPQGAPDDFGVDISDPRSPDEVDLLERRHRRTHQSVLEDAVGSAVAQLGAPRSLAVAHAFVTGGEASDSERQLVVGGTGEVSASVFEGFSYVALGHLHRPQAVAGPHVRYSGTPLAYSFSEDHEKSVVIIEMDPMGTVSTSTIPVGVGRGVHTITGELGQLLDPAFAPGAVDCFVRAVVTDRDTVLDAKAKLSQLYPHIAEVRLRPLGVNPDIEDPGIEIAELPPLEATKEFWMAAEGDEPSPEVTKLLADAIAHAQTVEAGTS
jgi:exonuclease SbcD